MSHEYTQKIKTDEASSNISEVFMPRYKSVDYIFDIKNKKLCAILNADHAVIYIQLQIISYSTCNECTLQSFKAMAL